MRRVRPIASNTVDMNRIEPYIREAETLDLIPAIGAGLYEKFTDDGFAASMQSVGSVTIVTESGRQVQLSRDGWDMILDGCYYPGGDRPCEANVRRYSAGLRAAVSYLAYARMLPNQPVNVTAFGVVNKASALSDPVDGRTLRQAAGEARSAGLEYLGQVADYLRHAGFIETPGGMEGRYRKIKIIG